MIDGLSLNFLRILTSESLSPELTDSARKLILDQILNSEVLNIFSEDNAQIKLGAKTVAAKLNPPLPASKLVVGQTLSGEVTLVFPDGRAQVKLEGHTFVADFKQPVTTGQSVSAKVEQLSPIPVISLTGLFENSISKDDRTTFSDRSITQAGNPASKDKTSTDSQKLLVTGDFLKKSDLESLNLSLGREVEGKVLANIDNGKVLIQVNNKQLAVKSLDRLSPDDAVLVKVEVAADQYKLVITPKISESQASIDPRLLKSYLPTKQPFGEMLGNLEKLIVGNSLLAELKIDPKLLESFKETLKVLIPGNPTPDENTIKKQIDQSGVNYEAKVRKILIEKPESEIISNKTELDKDLKGQLLRLAKEIESILVGVDKNSVSSSIKQNPKIAEALQYIKQATDNIELSQLSNHFAKQESQPVLLQIPYPSVENKTINLYVKKQPGGDKNNPGEKQSVNLVFLLDMTSLGSLRVDTQINNNQLTVKIGAEDQSVVDFVQANAVELKSRLQGIGFSADVSCCRQKKDDMRVDESLTHLFIQDPNRLVDIKT